MSICAKIPYESEVFLTDMSIPESELVKSLKNILGLRDVTTREIKLERRLKYVGDVLSELTYKDFTVSDETISRLKAQILIPRSGGYVLLYYIGPEKYGNPEFENKLINQEEFLSGKLE